MKYKDLKLLTCILIVFLLVNSVSATIGALAMTLGQNYALQIVAQNVDPMVMKAISFAIDPRSAATSEVIGYVGQISPELAKGLNIAQNPGAVAKQEILQRTLTEVAKKDPKTAMILANSLQISEYAKVAFQPDPKSKEPLAQADYDPKTGMMNIKRNGKEFAKIPEGYEIKNEKGILTFTNKEGTNKELQIGDYKVKATKDASIKYLEATDGSTTLELSEGEGSVTIAGEYFGNIKSATIKLDKNKQLEFAEFDSTKPQYYSFSYNKKDYVFKTTKENSHIKFDPKNKLIYGENIEMDFKNVCTESLCTLSRIEGTATITLDNKGDPSKVAFKADGVFKDEELGILATSKRDFEVCLNKDITCSTKDIAFSFENKEGGLVLKSRGELSYKTKNTQVDAFEKSETKMVVAETFNVLKVEKGSAKFRKDAVEGIITSEAGKTKVSVSPGSFTKPKKLTEALLIKDAEEYAITPKGNFIVEGRTSLLSSFDKEELQFLGFVATPVPPISATMSDTQLNIINQRIAQNNGKLKELTPGEGAGALVGGIYEQYKPSNLWNRFVKGEEYGEKELEEIDRLNEENQKLLTLKKELEKGISYDEALKNVETLYKYKVDKTDPTLMLLGSVKEDGTLRETGILKAANDFKAKGDYVAYFSAVEGYKDTVKEETLIDKAGKNLGSFNRLPDGSESITSLLDTRGLLGEKTELDKASVIRQLQREELPRLQTTQINVLPSMSVTSSAGLKKLLIDLENPNNYYVARNGELINYATHGEQIKEEIKRLESIERANPELFRSLSQNYNSAYRSKLRKGAEEFAVSFVDDPFLLAGGLGTTAKVITKTARYIGRAEIATALKSTVKNEYAFAKSLLGNEIGAIGDIDKLKKADGLLKRELGELETIGGSIREWDIFEESINAKISYKAGLIELEAGNVKKAEDLFLETVDTVFQEEGVKKGGEAISKLKIELGKKQLLEDPDKFHKIEGIKNKLDQRYISMKKIEEKTKSVIELGDPWTELNYHKTRGDDISITSNFIDIIVRGERRELIETKSIPIIRSKNNPKVIQRGENFAYATKGDFISMGRNLEEAAKKINKLDAGAAKVVTGGAGEDILVVGKPNEKKIIFEMVGNKIVKKEI